MLKLRYHSKFKKDYKLCLKSGCNEDSFTELLKLLQNETPLPSKYKEHFLAGNWKDFKECHISPDWLLIYKIEKDILTLTLARTGTHSNLF